MHSCRRRRMLLASTIFALTNIASAFDFTWPFTTQRFKGNALLEAGTLGLASDVRVIAFGDFNGDQFLDVLALGENQQTLMVYLWDHDDFMFRKSAQFRHPSKVYNVVPGDYTQDGRLDLLVMGKGDSDRQLGMSLYVGASGGGFERNPLHVPPSTLVQPIAFDANGDMKIDLLGIDPISSGSSSSHAVKFWQNVWDGTGSNVFNITTPNFNGARCRLSNPHSNAVVDLNGDCLADIFLVCDDGNTKNRHFQIWVNNKDYGFSLAQSTRLPEGTQAIAFADIDRDGTIDMIFPTCTDVSSTTGIGTECKINIAYNQQLPLCTSSTSQAIKNGKRSCRPPEELCTADNNFKFDLSERSGNDAFVSFPVSSLFPSRARSASSLLVLDTSSNPAIPLPLKLGDANLDGFPDLLPISVTGPSGDRIPRLVLSVPCAKGVAGCKDDGSGRRGWKVLTKGTETLESVTDARSVAFFDMDEDGTLDIMVQRTGQAGAGNVMFVQNNFYYDAFFLRAIVLNGACDNGWCTVPNSTERYHPYGVSYSGATFKYTVIDTAGGRSAAQVGQLPQTSYQSLLTPYSFFGLGRTNNYIENLFVGSTKHSREHYINMEGVIPNSKVVIIPPASAEGGAWRKELYLRPGEWIPWVTLTVIVATIVLAIIVLVLHLNEKRADELERRKASHHINFDAL
ncbi:hypothetical protein PUNSTDRAFT_121158 [Punctularia strigosozonata HHB-11173 SS5]|uniref:uncharacterized protein n=1 Tax=Punctularia strigosozonata (strain HHB-11173) TaxID=741275 RepID=UPI00044182F7|nr:uncharacterized protein PUNSTDRAFT_121158 [Punctularia strigosozonata HHB-11173 SS5]EIN08003.1 hypothetical protein PUNSTDRAFT_121158 [Punctularia strigosozonata HHB-11173 SS5]